MGHALRDLIKAKEAAARNLASANESTESRPSKRQRRESRLSRQGDEGHTPSLLDSQSNSVSTKKFVCTNVSPRPETVPSERSVGKSNSATIQERLGKVDPNNPMGAMGPEAKLNCDSKVGDSYDSDGSDQSGESEMSVDAEMERDYQAALRSMDLPISLPMPSSDGLSSSITDAESTWTPPGDNNSEKAYQAFMKQMGQATSGSDILPQRIKGGGVSCTKRCEPKQSNCLVQKNFCDFLRQEKITTESPSALQAKFDFTKQQQQISSTIAWNPPGDNEAEKAYQTLMRDPISGEAPRVMREAVAVTLRGGPAASSADDAIRANLHDAQSMANTGTTKNGSHNFSKGFSLTPPPSLQIGTKGRLSGVSSVPTVKYSYPNLTLVDDLFPNPIKEANFTESSATSNAQYIAMAEKSTNGTKPLLGSRQEQCSNLAQSVGNELYRTIIPP